MCDHHNTEAVLFHLTEVSAASALSIVRRASFVHLLFKKKEKPTANLGFSPGKCSPGHRIACDHTEEMTAASEVTVLHVQMLLLTFRVDEEVLLGHTH